MCSGTCEPTLLICISTDLSPFIIVIDIVQTIGSLLRHPTHEITRIIIELSTANSSQAVPGTIRFLTPGQPRQATALIGGASDATSLVIDSAPFWGLEALKTAFLHSTSTVQPPSGNSPVISTADRISASHPSSSHAKRLIIRNSTRPYPPIQLLAQRWEDERSAFAPPLAGEAFASNSGHYQPNEMIAVFGSSKQLALRRKSLPFDAGVDPDIYEQNTACNPSSVIGLIENTHLLGAPRAASHSVIATSHWSTTTQSNGELQAFPWHHPYPNQIGVVHRPSPSVSLTHYLFDINCPASAPCMTPQCSCSALWNMRNSNLYLPSNSLYPFN